jgi:uncharacterized membrane protein
MRQSLTLAGPSWPRTLSFAAGVGMMVGSLLTIQHFFAANYPASIYEGSFCDINAFFNCDGSAHSRISQILGVPLGYFGLMVGGLVCIGALFPSERFERTNRSIALANGIGIVALLLYSVFGLGSLCILCSIYYVFGLMNLVLFARYGVRADGGGWMAGYAAPSVAILATFGVVTVGGGYGFHEFHDAKRDAQVGGVATRVVNQFYGLPIVEWPSTISPFWTAKATDRFEDAPIRIVEYGDFLCPDCEYLNVQLQRLKQEFAGKINAAFQFFPLDAQCNDIVDKDKHPGACDLSYMSAYDPAKFLAIHDEVFGNLQAAKAPEWRADFARRHGVEAALTDSATKELVHRIMQTGAEYEKTSEQYAHGIRSTPTMIINNRMIIGTFPYEQLRAIFQALVDEYEQGSREFIEHWVETP